MDDVAIVGIDCRFPQAPDPDALWKLLLEGGDGVTDVPADRWRADDYYSAEGGPGKTNTPGGGFLDDADVFDYEFFSIAPREAALMDPQQRLLLHAAWRALEDATLDPRSVAGSDTGVFMGVMANEWANLHLADYAGITAQHGSGNGYFMTANRLSYHLDLKGPSMAVDTACSASLVAVHLAAESLRRGECEQCLAGGVNLVLTPALNIFYTQAGLSAPDGRCKPFSAAADGIVRGEGVGVLVLRRLADAEAMGLPIYAVIEGGAVNSDGRSNGITAPNRWSQQQVVSTAYERAGVRPDEISFVEAHGTGTILGDMIEVKALGEIHGVERETPCAIGSIKGNLGHTEGAAGIAAVIKVALSLHHGVVPPSRYADQANPRLRLDDMGLRLLDEQLELPAETIHAGVSSFGLGGTNAHLVLRSAPAAADADEAPDAAGGGLITLSSGDREGLARAATALADEIAAQPESRLAQICWSSNQIKASGRHRLAISAPDQQKAVDALRQVASDESALRDVSGVARRVATGWLFTGQGAEYPGMSRALCERSAAYRDALADVDEAMAPHLGRSIRELLLGDDELIHTTEFAQPAIFAVEYALARVLAAVGIEPAWVVGHSFGEYAAATHAGVFDLDDACKLVVARGALMQALPADGAMLAVRATVAEVREAIGEDSTVVLACFNGPQDLVLSGPSATVDRVRERMEAREMTARPLGAAHALHSPLMKPAADEFYAVVGGVPHRAPTIPIYSTLLGRVVEAGEEMDADYWAGQIVEPVRFDDAVVAALESEPTHLIEVTPRTVLAPLIRRIGVEEAPPVLVPCPGPDATGFELDEVVAALYRDGLDPDWDVLYEPAQRVRRRLGRYEFSTAHRSWIQSTSNNGGFRAPAPGAAATAAWAGPAPSTSGLGDTTMDQLIALFREQAAVLAAAAGAGEFTMPAAPAAAPDAGVIDRVLRAELARVSGFPEDTLEADQKLAADLGFDSIMVNDLVARLNRALPNIEIAPSIFETDLTIAELATHLGAGPSPASTPGGEQASPDSPPPAAAAAPRPDQYLIDRFPEVVEITDRIKAATEYGLENPYFLINDGVTQDTSVINGSEVVNYSSYNYLGLSGHPAVTAAVQEAVAQYGSSCSSSRMLSGEKPVHQELESELAALLGTDDAIALVSGHATNVTVIGHLVGPGDLVIHDALAHNSIVQGGELSGATRRPFPHNDAAALDEILAATRHQYRRVLIVIEGVYSQDGDIADLPAHIEVKKRHHALLMVDEAHSVGVLGEHGGGIGEHFGVNRDDVELWAGTMSKSLASCGGYVAGSDVLIQYLKYTTPGFIFSAGMSPANAAAALAALRQMKAEPETLAALRHNSELFLALATEAGINTADSRDTPIIPCIVGDSMKTLELSNALLKRGINVNPILYPAVPEDLARLRFFITSSHSDEQIRSSVKALTEELHKVHSASDTS
jgi:8-amino-7-oxononanoate synthase